jgi:hypothetical protein
MHVVTSFINNGDGFIIDVSKAEVITCLKYELFRRRRLCYIATVVGWIRNAGGAESSITGRYERVF